MSGARWLKGVLAWQLRTLEAIVLYGWVVAAWVDWIGEFCYCFNSFLRSEYMR